MCKKLLLIAFSFFSLTLFAQKTGWNDSLKTYLAKYIATHDVISGDDVRFFRFFPANPEFRVFAKFEKVEKGAWFQMESSGRIKQTFRVYGRLSFQIHDTTLTLNVYQSQNLMADPKYNSFLFIPFTDLSTGQETYHTGRYIDLVMQDIKNDLLELDFNKAYNPSCAYVSGKYNCPVPPGENNLGIAVHAGEMNFGRKE